MLGRLFLLFTLVPLVELALLIRLGEWIGLGPTVALVLVTGAVGAGLARREGLRSWTRVREELSRGRVPGEELVHALLLVVAGALLVTPGVLTDAVGLVLLLRPARSRLFRALRSRFADRIRAGQIRFSAGRPNAGDEPPGGEPASPAASAGSEDAAGHRSGWYRRQDAARRGEDRGEDYEEPERDTRRSGDGDGRIVEI